MKKLISATFSVAAQKDAASIDHIDNYYLTEATGTTPSLTDSNWQKVEDGAAVPVPTSAQPYLWHKYIIFLSDGSAQDPIIEFAGSLGKNGIDYDLVPSHSSIIKDEEGNVSPSSVSCGLILRNADGSAQSLSALPTGYSIIAYRDNVAEDYALGASISTANVSVITFALKYNTTEIERHDIHVISEGAQGLTGRGIQSQEVRFLALSSATTPTTPTDTTWSQWYTLANCGYSATTPYLYKAIKTTYVDGNNTTSTEYYIEGPTVWGQDGATVFSADIDNEMSALTVDAEGLLSTETSLSFNIKAFYGTSDVTSSCEVSCITTLPSGFSLNLTTPTSPTITIAANTTPAELTELTFRISHATYGTRDVVFSIAAIKAGATGNDAVIYQLLPSSSAFTVARTDDGGYNPSTVALVCGYTKRVGNAEPTTVSDAQKSFDGYNIYFRRYNRSTGWTTFYLYSTYRSNLIPTGVATYSKIEFVISTSTEATTASPAGIIDRETVPIIADGLNGSSPYTLDLDKDMSSVALTNAGVTSAAYSDSLALSAFYGATDVTASISNVSVSLSPSNSNISVDTSTLSAIKVSIPSGVAVDSKTNVTFTVVHPTYGTSTIVHTLAGVRAGAQGTAAVLYSLLPTLSQISFARDSAGALTPSSRTIGINIKKVEGTSMSILSLANSGLQVRYSYTSMPTSTSDGTQLPSSAPYIAVSSSTENTNLYFAAFLGTTLVDCETIPIIKDGAKGATGETGNGINTVSYYRMFTQGFEAPALTDAWLSRDACTEDALSATNRYLWEKKVTSYTKTSTIDNEISLIAQFTSGVMANILEDTAFLSDNDMDAWETTNGSVIPSQNTGLTNNGWQCTPDPTALLTEMLSQQVWNGSNITKLKPNTWYTLSFYAAQASYDTKFSGLAYNGKSSSQYYQIEDSYDVVRIEAGQTITVTFRGYVQDPSSAFMRCFAWIDSLDGTSTWLQNVNADITSSSPTTVSLDITNDQGTACLCRFAAYMDKLDGTAVSTSDTAYRGYITLVTVNRGMTMTTYLYRTGTTTLSIQGAPWYVDGKRITSPTTLDDGTYVSLGGDGSVTWKLTNTPTRHSVTFKTTSFATSTTDIFRVLFRLTAKSNYGWLSMPKLEENTTATEWIEASADRYADDYQHIYVGNWVASTSGTPSTYYLYAYGVRHVVRAKTSADGAYTYFRLKSKTASTGYCSLTEPYADTTHWERADYLKFVAADLMLSEEVITDKLTVSKVRSANDTFIIDEDGNVTATSGTFQNVTISGSTRNPFTLTSTDIDAEFNDNVAMYSNTETETTVYSLPWDKSQIGRRLTIANFYWNGKVSSGATQIKAPSGKYFYIDGRRASSLLINRQVVELMGFGTGDTFYGWIVLNLIDAYTQYQYGSPFKIVALGAVNGTASDTPTIQYQSINGGTMSVSRVGTGHYRISFPSSWFGSTEGLYTVWLQAFGMVRDSTTAPAKATLYSAHTSYFDVYVSDDATVNDGSFYFMMSNNNFANNWGT